MRAIIRAHGEGLPVENPVGGVLTFVARDADTGGAVTAFETVAAPGEGPPLHVHDEDELIYVVAGTVRVKVDGALHAAGPGAFVFLPAGLPHAWQNVGTSNATFFAAVVPAADGFERFFLAYRDLAPADRTPASFIRLAADTGAFRVVGPPLAESDPE